MKLLVDAFQFDDDDRRAIGADAGLDGPAGRAVCKSFILDAVWRRLLDARSSWRSSRIEELRAEEKAAGIKAERERLANVDNG